MSAVIDSNAIQAVFAQPRPDGSFEGPMREYLHAIGSRRSILLLAFAPKAAGTYFRQAAIYAINGQLIRMAHAQGGRDGRLYLPNVLACCLDSAAPDTVAHVHMQALAANRHFMDAVGLKPIIMLRNIPDMLASFLDMLDGDPLARAEGLNCLVPDNFESLDRARRIDFIVDVIAPWYASYFATWKSFADEDPRTVCVLKYRDFCGNSAQTLHAALAHAGFSVPYFKCEEALARVWRERGMYRFNKGVQGRGKDYFSAEHFNRLSRLLSYYPQLTPWLAELMGQDGDDSPGGELLRSPVTNVLNFGRSGPG